VFNKFCRFFWGETAFLVFTKRKGNLFFYKEKKREREFILNKEKRREKEFILNKEKKREREFILNKEKKREREKEKRTKNVRAMQRDSFSGTNDIPVISFSLFILFKNIPVKKLALK